MTIAPDGHQLQAVDFYSKANGRRLAVWTWQPPGPGPWPVLLLLQGVHDAGGHGWWLNGHAPQALAQLAARGSRVPFLVMPSDTGIERGSAWCDWADGSARAETFVIEELLPWLDTERELTNERWITGLSMGGYGALLLALRNPGTFTSATAMSAFFRPTGLGECIPADHRRIWGDPHGEAAHDVSQLLRDPSRRKGMRIAFDCGLDDPLLGANREMHEVLTVEQIPHGYAEPAGGHAWEYWRGRLPVHVGFHAGDPTAASEF